MKFWSLALINESLCLESRKDPNTININGPIRIQENNFISKLEYRNNFEVSFEFKASSIPSNQFHEIIIGKMTFQ